MKKKLLPLLNWKPKNKGQSLMEIAIVVGFLMVLAMGAVEFGYLLNQYITLVDGTRAGARYGSNQDPYAIEDPVTRNVTYNYSYVQPTFFTTIADVVDNSTSDLDTDPDLYRGAISPLILNHQTDELMVYFLSIREGQSWETSEIWCQFSCGTHPKTEALVNTKAGFIHDSLNDQAPNTGFMIVEIFYAYEQLLKLPIFTAFIPDPIQVHAYSIMPLSAAEPTPVVVAPAVIAGQP